MRLVILLWCCFLCNCVCILYFIDDFILLQESSSKLADSIKIGPWGGPGGNQHWSFKAKVAITEIIITHGMVVDSVSFTSIDENGKIEHSEKFGGGGGKIEKVSILIDYRF